MFVELDMRQDARYAAADRTATRPGPHVFKTPVVREVPRPIEPAAPASEW